MFTASWIWSDHDPLTYNQSLLARRDFTLAEWKAGDSAVIRITADSWYRLFLNGQWVADGPARSWPEHYQYDEIDAAPYLTAGRNELRVIVRYWGVGNFHTLPQQAGLLAQLDVTPSSGESLRIMTDSTWQVAHLPAWLVNTPKVSIQMEPQEIYDARLGDPKVTLTGEVGLQDNLEFKPAKILYAAGEGPWTNLNARDVAMLSRDPVMPVGLPSVVCVSRIERVLSFTFPAARLAHPDLVEANGNTTMPGGLITQLELDQETEINFNAQGVRIYVDGKDSTGDRRRLPAGNHIVLVFVSEAVGHNKEKSFWLEFDSDGMYLVNLLDKTAQNPWLYLAFPEFAFSRDDQHWSINRPEPQISALLNGYAAEIDRLAALVTSPETFRSHLSTRARQFSLDELFLLDTHWRFLKRQVLEKVDVQDEMEWSKGEGQIVLQPSLVGDLELCFDFGVQTIGYYDFMLEAEAGVEVDVYAVEYITPEGEIQHTPGNRNGLTFITDEGVNCFVSSKRRSGRYVFITLRNQRSPVRLRRFQVIESTYPFEPAAEFACSDERLDRIWEISARTLKLCMEDTFTDCPLYEQTHWVGDARNEALYGYDVLGAVDIARRCIRLTGQSLERFPITGCQTPSGWDVILPAWSFLWTISVWDYYFYSGDAEFLREVWPWVIQNLRGAQAFCTDEGLFSSTFWNLFDWSGIDDQHDTVLHNSLLLVGALDAAGLCAGVLQESATAIWLDDFRSSLTAAVNRWWDPERRAYPDSRLADGTFSRVTSQHTSFLALLYDVIPEAHAAQALENSLNPPEGMVRVGSPFAMQYYFEALEKAGREDLILKSIYDSYLPMLELGSTTVWETFPGSDYNPVGFPTRSHCHAWSSAPLYFLPRILLGIRPVKAGGTAFQVSPHLMDALEWARCTVVTARGPLSVEWRRKADGVQVHITAPEGTDLEFVPNLTHEGLQVGFSVKNVSAGR